MKWKESQQKVKSCLLFTLRTEVEPDEVSRILMFATGSKYDIDSVRAIARDRVLEEDKSAIFI